MNTAFNEPKLVTASLKGDRQAFGQIVSRYQSSICGIAYAATGDLAQSEDIAQETFITAWHRLSTLREPEKLGAWIRAIARNVIQSYFRKTQREVVSQAELIDDQTDIPATAEETPHERVVSKEEQQLLWKTLAELPEQYRVPLVLYYRQSHSTKAVAEAMEIPEATVRQRLSRGRELLREQMAAFIEGTLERTNPDRTFTMGVLAALPIIAASQTAAATMAATAAKGTAALKSAGAFGIAATLLGPALGILGGVIGLRARLEAARSPRERAFVKTAAWVAVGCLFAFIALMVAAAGISKYLVPIRPDPVWFSVYLFALGSLGGVCPLLFVRWFIKGVQRIRMEDGTNLPEPEAKARISSGRIAVGFSAGMILPISWTIPASIAWGPWWVSAIFISVAIVYSAMCIRDVMKNPTRFWIVVRSIVSGAASLNLFGVLHFWEKSGLEALLPLGSGLSLVLGLGVLLYAWCYVIEKRQK